MNNDDAQKNLDLAREGQRRAARTGALAAAAVTAVMIIAYAAVVDLDMLWLLGVVTLAVVVLSVARPIRLRLDWSDRRGVVLFVASILAVIGVYVATQALVRALDWAAPNTISALIAAVVIFVVCAPALVRLATRREPLDGGVRRGDA